MASAAATVWVVRLTAIVGVIALLSFLERHTKLSPVMALAIAAIIGWIISDMLELLILRMAS
jgi:hypothetical protein